MMILKRFAVDLENPGSTPIIPAVQNGCCALGLEMELRKNQRPYRIPKEVRAVVRYKKLDGKGGEYDTMGDGTPAWTAALDRLTVKLAQRIFSMPGSVEVTVTLYQAEEVIGNIPVILYVEGSANAALPDSGEHMSGSAVSGWPAPETAKVGQFLRVAAVDENGKVTVLDTSEVSSFPDWNQHDEAQAGYIRNRPFYIYTEETDTVGWDSSCELLSMPGDESSPPLLRLPAEVTLEDLLGGLTLQLISDTGEVIEFSDFEGPYTGKTICEPVDDVASVCYFFDQILGFYVSQDGYAVPDTDPPVVFPRAGLWLYSGFDILLPSCKQFFIFRKGPVRAERVVQISSRFIPELPYIPEADRAQFMTEEDIVGRRTDTGGELFNTASSASGTDAHAEGRQTSADGNYSHAEGYQTIAYGSYSHAEGSGTEANSFSHAEGYLSKAIGLYAHAEGFHTEVRAMGTHAEGWESEAHGNYSHAEGNGTLANSESQHSQGRFNVADGDGKYAHIVGNGTDKENRSNAHTLDWAGNGWFAGRIKVGGTGQEDENAQELPTRAEVQEMIRQTGGGTETETVLSDNLLDLSLLTRGKCFYYSGSGFSLVDSTDSYYGFIPLRGAGTYRTKFQASVHSSTNKRIVLVNDNDEWVATVTGSHGEIPSDDTRNWLDFEFVITQSHIAAGATKVAYDAWVLYLDQTMIVKDREYPSSYIPYGYIEVTTDSGKKLGNILSEKTAVFLGDSICAGTTVDANSGYYGYGWGGIIGEANHMTWKNYGKNGGTITHRGSDASCIAKIADTAIAEYPNADYVIFEGGCNDADQMKDSGLGEISGDYANFDTTTFSGALESLILKILTNWPTAKVGYIIPQKMYTGYSDYSAANHIHRKYFERAIEICEKWGIPYVDLWNRCPLNPKLGTAGQFYVEENGQHLTLAGYERITPKIEAFMRGL